MPKQIKEDKSHDSYFKKAMSRLIVAQQFFETHLPAKILNKVDLKTIKVLPDSFIDHYLGKGMVDMLFSVNMEGKEGYLYLLVEHQSTQDRFMPFRIFKYMLQICEKHMKKHKNAKHLPFIYPLIFYSGQAEYKAPLDLWSLFENSKLAKEVYTNDLQLIEVQKVDDKKLKEKIWSGLMQFFMKKIHAKNLHEQLENFKLVIIDIANADSAYILDTIWYTISQSDIPSEVFVAKMQEILPDSAKKEFMSIKDQWIQQGEQKGEERGIKLGEERGIKLGEKQKEEKLVLKMISEGLDNEFIARISSLSVKEIQSLRKSAKK